MENINGNNERVLRTCEKFGLVPDRTETERVYRKGKPVGYAIRCFFRHKCDQVLELGECIIQLLGGFGRIIHQLDHTSEEEESILEVSFKL